MNRDEIEEVASKLAKDIIAELGVTPTIKITHGISDWISEAIQEAVTNARKDGLKEAEGLARYTTCKNTKEGKYRLEQHCCNCNLAIATVIRTKANEQ